MSTINQKEDYYGRNITTMTLWFTGMTQDEVGQFTYQEAKIVCHKFEDTPETASFWQLSKILFYFLLLLDHREISP